MSLGSASYGLAALAFVVLTLLLLIGSQGRTAGIRVIVASLASALWALVLAVQAASAHFPFLIVYVAELLRDGAWLAVLAGMARPVIPRAVRLAAPVLWCAMLLWALALAPLQRLGIGPDEPLLLLVRSGLGVALVALVLIEHVYRSASASARSGLRYFAFGIGGMFAYDLFLYSQAELLRQLSFDAWNARGVVNALVVPAVAIGVRRSPQWSLDIFVSRHVVFYSGSLLLVGAYLLLMALGGYYVRSVGGTWGGVAQIVFLAGSGLVLAALILSGRVRAGARVFLSKHFYRNKYDYRIEWLRFIHTLSSSGVEDVGRTALRAVAQIFSSPRGVLFVADDSGRRYVPAAVWPKDAQTLAGLQDVASSDDLVVFLRDRQWIIDLQEHRASPEAYDNLKLPVWASSNTELRLIAPLLALDRLVGFVALDNPPTRFRMTYEDRDLLKTVGRHVATHIAQHEADRRLADRRQFDAYNQLTAFMMHDLKNSVAQLKLLVTNAARHKHNPDFIDDAIGTIANTVERMTRLTEQLKQKAVIGSPRPADLNELARSAVERCRGRQPVPDFRPGATPTMVEADPEKLTSALEHVIRNAQDATPPRGSVEVRLRSNATSAVIEISDTGCGMDAEFVRHKLFRAFVTTKGAEGMGIGAFQAREYVRLLGGEVEVQSRPGQGTTFSINLPLVTSVAAELA